VTHWSRAAAVTGAVLIVLAVVLPVWWTFGASGFTEEGGRLGLYHGTWYAAPFGHDADMSRYGGSTLGVIAFFAGLVAAAALVMTALASGQRVTSFAGAAQLACGVAVAAGLGALATHTNHAPESAGVGPLLLLAGVALGIAGARRTSGEWRLPVVPATAVNAMTFAACALVFFAITSQGFWHWTWSDESVHVGLVDATRCFRGLSHCPTEHIREPFMLDGDERFIKLAEQTRNAAIAVIVLALVGAFAKNRRGVAHAPWVVLALLTAATLALTPDLGTARDVHLGFAFPMLFGACAIGIACGVLRE
jgi:hypothetical protein